MQVLAALEGLKGFGKIFPQKVEPNTIEAKYQATEKKNDYTVAIAVVGVIVITTAMLFFILKRK